MKVILIEEMRGLGTRGEVVSVKDGYARNLIFYFAGTGKVWIDDVEVFTWELGAE